MNINKINVNNNIIDNIDNLPIDYIKDSCLIGPNTRVSEYKFISSNNWPRANRNTNNLQIRGIIVYAIVHGNVNYGKINSKFETELIGNFTLKHNGWNFINFENIVKTNDDEFLYLLPSSSSAKLALYQKEEDNEITPVGLIQGQPNPLLNASNYELQYYCITVNSNSLLYSDEFLPNIFEKIQNVPSQEIKITPSTPIQDINQYHNAQYFRANAVKEITVIGLKLYLDTNHFYLGETLNIVIFNSQTLESTIIKTITLDDERRGESYVYFNNYLTLSSDEYLGMSGVGAGSLSTHTTNNAIGMVEYTNDGAFNSFPSWEMSYEFILERGFNITTTFIDYDERLNNIEINNKSYLGDMKYGEIIIPKRIEVAKSRQCNLWWDCIANYLIGDKSVYFETHCSIGHNLERCYRINGSEHSVGDYQLRIVSRYSKTREIISDETITISIVNDTVGTGSRQILMIGDSRTWHSVATEQGVSYNTSDQGGNKTITTEVKRLTDANKGATFTFLGTFVSPLDSTVKNLAESGGTYSWANEQIGQSIVSYIENQCSGTALDYTTIMFGINDIEDWNNNQISQYEKSINKITTVLNDAKSLVDKILTGYPNCKIIMVIEPTCCGNQDGFGTWGQTNKDQHLEIEFAQKCLRKKFLQMFDEHKYGNNVYVSSAGIWCDRLYGFPYTKEYQSSRASEKIVELFRNSVHPHDDGYRQIADGIYSTIKYLEQ